MPDMPIDPEFGRFIDGITQTPNGGAIADVDLEEEEVEEMPDGSAIVRMPTKTPADDTDFYDNLAESFDPISLERIAMRYIELISKDREDRKDRDKKYAEGLKRSGLGDDAPGGAS